MNTSTTASDMSDWTKLSQCPCCNNADIQFHSAGHDFHYRNEGLFSTDRCQNCGLIFMNPMPGVPQLARFYGTDYYSFQPPAYEPVFKTRLRRLLGLERHTHIPVFSKPGVMVDIGCGAGHYLLRMRAKGWQVFGSELSNQAAQTGQTNGLDIRAGQLFEAGFSDAMFDFVRSNHSFEHMPNPGEVLNEMHRIMKPDGKLFIGIPNVAGFWARLFGVYWWNLGLPVHVHNYTPTAAQILLERHGFRVERIIHNSEWSGLLGSLQIYLNRNDHTRTPEGRVVRNKLLRLPAFWLSKVLDFFGQGDCIEIICVKS
jgi:SAM-dependent methyltransferase